MDCSGHQRGSAEPGPFLLVCDLDGTLLGDDEALTTFFASWRARLLLEADMRQAGRSKLVYATGRPHGDYIWLVDSGQLEPPDVAITYTGADIRHAADDQVGRLWARHVAACWDPVAVKDALDAFGFPLLEVGSHRMVYGESQEETGQCITEDVIRSMRGVLACAGQDAELILSNHHDGTFLDVLPKGIDKGSAVKFVREYFRIPFEQTVVAGDSWNDWAMMERGGAMRVLVANASASLIERTKAFGPEAVFLSKVPFAGGVVDGCRHFGIFP